MQFEADIKLSFAKKIIEKNYTTTLESLSMCLKHVSCVVIGGVHEGKNNLVVQT